MIPVRLAIALTLFGLAAPVSSGAAQLPNGTVSDSATAAALGLTPGARLRYATHLDPVRRRVSQLRRAERDTLWLLDGRALAIPELAHLEVSRGQRSLGRAVGRGMLWGAALGGVLGALQEPKTPEAIFGFDSRAEGASSGAILGVVIGGLGGAFFGQERWEAVRPRAARTGQRPAA